MLGSVWLCCYSSLLQLLSRELLKRKGLKSVKIPGAEFWLDIIKKFHEEKSFFFIGASQEIIEKTVHKVKSEYPRIKIKGYRNGFLKEGDKKALIKNFKEVKPDIILPRKATREPLKTGRQCPSS